MEHFENFWNWIFQHPHVSKVVTALAVLIIGGLLIRLCRRSVELVARGKQVSQLTARPLHYFITWGGYLLIAALILSVFGVPVLTMVGTVVAMIALGFVAIWSVLTNITCAILMMVFQPFQMEDEIEFPTEEGAKGRVQDMNFIYTTLVTENGDEFRIPNNLFFQKVFRRRKASR